MKVKVLNKSSTDSGTKELPQQFLEPVRPDIIKRAVHALQANKRQKYGAKEGAGMRHSARISKKRRDYRTSYGYGISRVPRKILSRRGRRMNWQGAIAPGTVGGRRAHAPKASKNWSVKINKKERRKAIRSALAATVAKDIVEMRGHRAPKNYPFIVKSEIEGIKKTSELTDVLEKLGFSEELERTTTPKLKSGRAKRRGRGKSYRTGLLIVVSKESDVIEAAANIPGVEAVPVKELNAELLAPGAHPGRITLYTDAAIDIMEKEGVFTNNYKGGKK